MDIYYFAVDFNTGYIPVEKLIITLTDARQH